MKKITPVIFMLGFITAVVCLALLQKLHHPTELETVMSKCSKKSYLYLGFDQNLKYEKNAKGQFGAEEGEAFIIFKNEDEYKAAKDLLFKQIRN